MKAFLSQVHSTQEGETALGSLTLMVMALGEAQDILHESEAKGTFAAPKARLRAMCYGDPLSYYRPMLDWAMYEDEEEALREALEAVLPVLESLEAASHV